MTRSVRLTVGGCPLPVIVVQKGDGLFQGSSQKLRWSSDPPLSVLPCIEIGGVPSVPWCSLNLSSEHQIISYA